MKTISHFNLPENTNSLYQKEAVSSISLTRDGLNNICTFTYGGKTYGVPEI